MTTSGIQFFFLSSFFFFLMTWKRMNVNPCRPFCSITASYRLRHYRRAQAKPSKTTLVHSAHCWMTSLLHISFQKGTHFSARHNQIWIYIIIQAGKFSPAFCSKQDHLSSQTRLLRTLSRDRNGSTSLSELFHCLTACCNRCHWNQ